jgi:hypothetical protein
MIQEVLIKKKKKKKSFRCIFNIKQRILFAMNYKYQVDC